MLWICPECRSVFERRAETCDRDGAPLAEVQANQTKARYPLLGRVVGDRYHLIGGLGQGGLGTVYLAQHRHLGQLFAVKFLDLQTQGAPGELDETQKTGYRKDFLREAQVASLVRHPSVVRVTDFGEHEGMPFLVMEYVPGPSLLHLLGTRGRFTTMEAMAIARRIAEALDAFHERRLVHRDVKPANVILDPRGDGRLTLVDLGLVKDLSGPGGKASTHPMALRGTPGYLAPEQVPSWVLSSSGVKPMSDKRVIDARADLYALGVIFYEMLAGVSPYPEGSSTSVIIYACTKDPIALSDVDPPVKLLPGLEQLVLDTMHRDPERRPASAAAFLDRLDEVAYGQALQGSWPAIPAGRRAASGGPGASAELPPESPPPQPAPAATASDQTLLRPPLPEIAVAPPTAQTFDDDDEPDDSLLERTAVFADDGPAPPTPTPDGPFATVPVGQADRTFEAEVRDSFDVPGGDLTRDELATRIDRRLPAAAATVAVPAVQAPPPQRAVAVPAKRPAGHGRALKWLVPVAVIGAGVGIGAWLALRQRAPDPEPVQIVRVGAPDPNLADAGSPPATTPDAVRIAVGASDARVPDPAPPVADAAPPPSAAAPASVGEVRPPPSRPVAPRPAPRPVVDFDALVAQGDAAWKARDFATALSRYEVFLSRADQRHAQYAVVRTRVDFLREKLKQAAEPKP